MTLNAPATDTPAHFPVQIGVDQDSNRSEALITLDFISLVTTNFSSL